MFFSTFPKKAFKRYYYYLQHSKMAKWRNHFISDKQLKKDQMATLIPFTLTLFLSFISISLVAATFK